MYPKTDVQVCFIPFHSQPLAKLTTDMLHPTFINPHRSTQINTMQLPIAEVMWWTKNKIHPIFYKFGYIPGGWHSLTHQLLKNILSPKLKKNPSQKTRPPTKTKLVISKAQLVAVHGDGIRPLNAMQSCGRQGQAEPPRSIHMEVSIQRSCQVLRDEKSWRPSLPLQGGDACTAPCLRKFLEFHSVLDLFFWIGF